MLPLQANFKTKTLIESLRDRIELKPKKFDQGARERDRKKYIQTRDDLTAYSHLLAKTFAETDLKVFDIMANAIFYSRDLNLLGDPSRRLVREHHHRRS